MVKRGLCRIAVRNSYVFGTLEAGISMRATVGDPHGAWTPHLGVARVPLSMHVLDHVASQQGSLLYVSLVGSFVNEFNGWACVLQQARLDTVWERELGALQHSNTNINTCPYCI